jgi:LRR receptor-like serine/threonine-protein kinase FLS2
MTGEIPLELYSPNLLKLRLTENQWKGTIPPKIAGMVSLTDYTVGSSQMSGPIPSELFTIQTLEVLDLHNASFSGPLSEAGFSNLTSLVRWEVQDNDFTGAIPFSATLLMANLERFQVQGNDQLTGTVPSAFCALRGTKPTEIQVVFVGCNVQCNPGCCDANPACSPLQ